MSGKINSSKEVLEVFCDASLLTFQNTGRVFTCSGSICRNTAEERYQISPDSTNNRGELVAIYLGVKLAEEMLLKYPGRFGRINLYSDSQFGIFGIKKWIGSWMKNTDSNGIMYGSSNTPVKNQELFLMIITYMVTHDLVVHFFHQKGHVHTGSKASLDAANDVFCNSNGFKLSTDDIFKISFYNNVIDLSTRNILKDVNPYDYPKIEYGTRNIEMCQYIMPNNYRNYVK